MEISIWINACIYIGLPIVFLWTLSKESFSSKRAWWVDWSLTFSFLLFIFLVGSWHMFAYYFRYIFAVAFVIVTWFSYRKNASLPERKEKGNKRFNVSLIFKSILALYFVFQSFMALTGYTMPEDQKLELSFPLKDGVYVTHHGGSSEMINYHHIHPKQAYAYDISKLNVWGNRAEGLAPSELEGYKIYNQPLYSPCSGTIVEAADQYEDVPPMKAANGEVEELAGNHVYLQCEGARILIAHMKNGSVEVEAGDSVLEGEMIGRVGNSGNTTEPHLHIHAVKNGEGVPITFDGRFLKRNSLVFRD